MFQTRLRHVFRTDWRAANPLAIVTGAAGGAGLAQARRCADDGFDLVIADDQPEIFSVGPTLIRAANRIGALRADLATVEGAVMLLDAAGERLVAALYVHGLVDSDGTRHLLDTVRAAMVARGAGRIVIEGRAVYGDAA